MCMKLARMRTMAWSLRREPHQQKEKDRARIQMPGMIEMTTPAMGIVTQWAITLQTSDFYGPPPPTPNTQAPHDRPPPPPPNIRLVENGKIWNLGKRSTWGKA